MNRSRIVKCLSAVSLVATLALPVAAHAMPIVEVSAAPVRNHIASTSRATYYAAKERQFEGLDNANLRHSASRQAARRSAASYAAMKDRQMERILNGE